MYVRLRWAAGLPLTYAYGTACAGKKTYFVFSARRDKRAVDFVIYLIIYLAADEIEL